MKISKENIQSVFIWIGVLFFLYIAFADAKPRQALKKIEKGNAPQSVKNHVSGCEQILNDVERVGLLNYWGNGKRDAPEAPQQNNLYNNGRYYNQQTPPAPQYKGYNQQAQRVAPPAPQYNEYNNNQQRKKWNPFKRNK